MATMATIDDTALDIYPHTEGGKHPFYEECRVVCSKCRINKSQHYYLMKHWTDYKENPESKWDIKAFCPKCYKEWKKGSVK